MPRDSKSRLKRSYSHGSSGRRRGGGGRHATHGSSSARGGSNKEVDAMRPSETIRSPKNDLVVSYAIIESAILRSALELGCIYDDRDAVDLANTHHRDSPCNVVTTKEAAFITFRPISFPDDMQRCMTSMPTRRRIRSKSESEQMSLVKGLCQCHLRFLHLMPIQSQVYLVSIRDDDGGYDDDDDDDESASSSSDGDDDDDDETKRNEDGSRRRRSRRHRRSSKSKRREWHFLVKWDDRTNDWHRSPIRLGVGKVSKLDFNAPDLLEFIGISPSVVPSSSSNSRNGGRSSGNSRNSSDEGRTLPTRIVLGDTIVLSNNGGGNNDSFLVAPYNLMAEYNDESKCVPQDLKMQLQGERSTLDYTSKLHMRYPRYADLLDYSAADWHRAKTINHGGFGVIMTVPWKSSSLFKDDDQEGYTTVVVKVSRESKKDGDGKMKRISHLRRLKHALCEAAYALAIGNHPLVDNSNDGDERNYRMNHGMKTALESFAKCYGWFIYGDGELAIVMERLDVDVNRALGYRQKDKKRIKQEIKRMAKDRRINFDDDDDDGSIIGRSDNVAKTQDELDEEEEALVLKWAKKRCTIGRGQALKIVYAMVHALVEMHDGELFGGGFIHRDIKPHNIMLNSDNEPRIIDFSFCLPLGSKSSISSTYIYSPPPFNREKKEQQDQQENSGRNDSHYYDTGACDWYALAVMVVNDIDPVIPLSKRVYDAAAMLMSNIADYGEEFDSVLVDRFVDIVDEKYFKYNGRRRSSSRGRSRSNSSTSRSKSEDDDDDDGHSSASSHYSRDSEYDSQEEGDYEAYATDGAGHYDVDSYDEDPKSYQSPLPPPPRHAEYRGATDNDIQDWWRDQRGPSIVSAIARRVSVAAMASPSSSSAPSPTQHDPTNGRQSWRSTPPANYD